MHTFHTSCIFPFLPHGNICKDTCILSKFKKSKLLQCKPRVRIFPSNRLTAQKLPLFVFEKFIDCDWSKKHVTISYVFKMATALKTDQINEEYFN